MRRFAFCLMAVYYVYLAGMVTLAPRPSDTWTRVVAAFVFGGGLPFYLRFFRAVLLRDTVRLRGREVRVQRRDRWGLALLFVGVSLPLLELFLQSRIHADRLQGYHPFLQNLPVPGDETFHINSLGFRSDEALQEKPVGIFRVVFMGGSTVFAAEVDFEKSHPRLVELALREAYPDQKIEVLNAAVPWHSSAHSLIRYPVSISDLKPDLVIVWHGINDLWRGFSSRRFASGPFRRDYGHFLGSVSRLVFGHFGRPTERVLDSGLHSIDVPFNQIYRRMHDKFAVPVPIDLDEVPSVPVYRRNMDYLIRLVKSDGVPILLASQPSLYKIDLTAAERAKLTEVESQTEDGEHYASLGTMIRGMEQLNSTARKLATKHRVAFVDLAKLVPKDLDHFVDDVHYTEAGNRVIADAVVDAVKGMSLLVR